MLAQSGLDPVFANVEDFAERSSALLGSPQQIIDKVHRYHTQLGHSAMFIESDSNGLTPAQHRDSLDRFAGEIAPVLRRALPDPPWPQRAGDPAGTAATGRRDVAGVAR